MTTTKKVLTTVFVTKKGTVGLNIEKNIQTTEADLEAFETTQNPIGHVG